MKPLREGRHYLASKYRNLLLSDPYMEMVPIEQDISEQAAALRAKYSIKTPDAIQVTAAQLHRADVFLTNDSRLEHITEVKVVALSVGRLTPTLLLFSMQQNKDITAKVSHHYLPCFYFGKCALFSKQ